MMSVDGEHLFSCVRHENSHEFASSVFLDREMMLVKFL